MTSTTPDNFPESSLAGEYGRVARSSAGRLLSGRQQFNNYYNNSVRGQDGILGAPGHKFKQGTEKPAQLAATLTRQPVNIDQSSAVLHQIGRANTGTRWRKRGDNTEATGEAQGSIRRSIQETRWQAPPQQPALIAGSSTTTVRAEGARDSQGGSPGQLRAIVIWEGGAQLPPAKNRPRLTPSNSVQTKQCTPLPQHYSNETRRNGK